MTSAGEEESPALSLIAAEVRRCTLCDLCKERTNAVPGEGPSHASVVIVGEGPGRNEDLEGRPFVGSAGRNLDALLNEAGLDRTDVFITNVVKCRPPLNRKPTKHEADTCNQYLRRQLEAIKPKLVVLLGDSALKQFFPAGATLSETHGKKVKKDNFWLLPTYHPASVIYNPSLGQTLIEDFRLLGTLSRDPAVSS